MIRLWRKGCFCMMACILVLLSACSVRETDKSDGADTEITTSAPAVAYGQFIKALNDDDYDTAWNLLSEESRTAFTRDGKPSREVFKQVMKQELESDGERLKALTSAVPGSLKISAVLTIKMKKDNQVIEEEVPLIYEDDGWKVKI